MNLTETVENKALVTHSIAKLLCFQTDTTDAVRKRFKAKTIVGFWAMKAQQTLSSIKKCMCKAPDMWYSVFRNAGVMQVPPRSVD